MTVQKHRTHSTDLSNDELLILDLLFDLHTTAPMLRRCNIVPQFNSEPHGLSDTELRITLDRFMRDGITTFTDHEWNGHRYIALTEHGGQLWEQERCPIWNRYCTDRYKTTSRDRTLLSVVAVSPSIRDDFLRLWPEYPARRKKRTISDYGLISWRAFPELHVGLATYDTAWIR